MREGGKEDTKSLRRDFWSPHRVPPDWIVEVCLPWWQEKALLALAARIVAKSLGS